MARQVSRSGGALQSGNQPHREDLSRTRHETQVRKNTAIHKLQRRSHRLAKEVLATRNIQQHDAAQHENRGGTRGATPGHSRRASPVDAIGDRTAKPAFPTQWACLLGNGIYSRLMSVPDIVSIPSWMVSLDWTSLLIGGLIGYVLNLAASWSYDKIRAMLNARKIELDGLWAEYVPDSGDHQYSLGRIYFDKSRNIFAFDGTNYFNDGQPFCHWKTVTSYIDKNNQEYFYVFVAQVENELDHRYYGFGVVNLAVNDKGILVPARGHYVSANIDGRPMSHTIVPAEELSEVSETAGDKLIAFLERSKPTAH